MTRSFYSAASERRLCRLHRECLANEMRLLPITEWLQQYQRANLRTDVIAGAALAGLLIPEAMGYAGIAGLPPQAGLYATVFGPLAYAIFGSSRQLVVSPTSASSAILAATIAHFRRISPIEFRASLAAIIGVIAFDILNGLALAVLLTLIALMRFLVMPQVVVLGRLSETGKFAEIVRHPEAEQIPGVLILRVDRIWFFANANGIRDHAKALMRQAPGSLHSVIFNLAPVDLIDVTAVEVLSQLHASSVKHGRRMALAEVRDPVRDTLERAGLLSVIGPENVFRSLGHAV